MQLPEPFQSLIEILPVDMFLSFSCLIAPKIFEDPRILEQMRDLEFLTTRLDNKISEFFNHISDLFYFHANACKQIISAVEGDGPLFLYLRDFSFTGAALKCYAKEGSEGWSYLKNLPMLDHSLQHMLAESASSEFPIVTIRHLSGVSEKTSLFPYKELPSLMLNDAQWQDVTDFLISAANGIVLHVGHLGDGTQAELECIRKHQRQHNTVLAIEQFETKEPPQDIIEALLGKPFYLPKEAKREPLSEADIAILFHDFPYRTIFCTNGFLVGKHLTISKLRQISKSNPVRDSSKLGTLISHKIYFPGFLPQKTIRKLEQLIIQIQSMDLIRKSRIDTELIIQALYSHAALLLILGRIGEAVLCFGQISIYAEAIIRDPLKKEKTIQHNIIRMAACMSWCGLSKGGPDIAIHQAWQIYKHAKAELGLS
jgi:hypothetical protein